MNNVEYLNIWKDRCDEYPFQIFIGARDGGKTYSYLKGLVEENGRTGAPFLYTRRTTSEIDACLDTKEGVEVGNPFSKLNRDMGWSVGFSRISKTVLGIYHREEYEEGRYKPTGNPIGYATHLGALARLKGINMEYLEDWFYDEFIAEPHVPRIKNEGSALLSAYDTLARNREVQGKSPLKLTLCSNATNIYNEVAKELGIVRDIEIASVRGKEKIEFPGRGLRVHLCKLPDSLREARDKTALGKLTKGSRYYEMAFGNEFSYNDFTGVRWRNLKGWAPIASIDGYTVYRKKGERLWHVSYQKGQCMDYISRNDSSLMLFRRIAGGLLLDEYIKQRVDFESYEIKAFFLEVVWKL